MIVSSTIVGNTFYKCSHQMSSERSSSLPVEADTSFRWQTSERQCKSNSEDTEAIRRRVKVNAITCVCVCVCDDVVWARYHMSCALVWLLLLAASCVAATAV